MDSSNLFFERQKLKFHHYAITAAALALSVQALACTGITLNGADGSRVTARSIEWGSSVLPTTLVVVPRGTPAQTQTAEGAGMQYKNTIGYAGLSIEDKSFVVEGLNEKGLSAGLFFFPGYGQYPVYDTAQKDKTLSDMEFVAWVLGNFESVKAARAALPDIRVAERFKGAGTVHYRIADKTGDQIVVEIVDGKMRIFDNPIGVLTNSPGFEWQMTNLNNFMNLKPGRTPDVKWNNITLKSPGIGSGMAGLPGDITPPSRFVRAAFMVSTAPALKDGQTTVLYSFKILNAFEIPIGLELENGNNPTGLLSATQWTSASDMTNGKLYYKTMNNARVRCLDLKTIDFSKVTYQTLPIEKESTEPIESVTLH